MRVFATLSDKNYLLNGLALYESLNSFYNDGEFMLYYLCLDDETYITLVNTHFRNITPIHINIFDSDKAMQCAKQNHESRPIDTSDGQSPFHWAMAPMLVNLIINYYHQPHCLYIDSDIYFYQHPETIFHSVEGYDVGLITHKHCPLEKSRSNVGFYNVGIIYFKDSTFGSACCRWWRDVVVDTSNPWFHPFGSCGDQKYLEIFEDIFPHMDIKIIDRDVGHSAPWNLGPSTLLGGTYIWPSQFVIHGSDHTSQPLVFHHFSHFTPDYINNTWSHQRKNEWGNCVDTPSKQKMYQEYFDTLKQVKEKHGI